jgi:penicillin-binding protein 1A
MMLVFVIGGIGLGYVAGAIKNMPEWDPTKLNAAETTYIYDYKGQLASKLHSIEDRENVSLNRMPSNLKNAFIATEDNKFYSHRGFRIDAIARATLANVIGGWGSEGGSTITMQLVNHAFFEQNKEKKLERKIQELILAVQMERKYTKDEILELYLNRIYFNGGAYGVQAAAKYYYGKNVEDLELHESAMLAGLVNSPARYSPIKNPEAAKGRQETVLQRMVTNGYITEAQANQAKAKPLVLTEKESSKTYEYQHFIDHILEEGTALLGQSGNLDNPEQALFQKGLRIFTTLDAAIQKNAEEVYSQDKNFPPGKDGKIVQSAVVVLDPSSGAIKALVGGRNVEQKRGFNRATAAKRQPGSSFKPIAVFAPALLKGFSPGTVLDDSPVTYQVGNNTWSPRNYNEKYLGPITMRTAAQLSVNIYAVKMLEIIGPAEGLRFAESLGISTLVSKGAKSDLNLSMALGGLTYGVTPLEMTAAYGTFANQGIYNKPYAITKITDKDGNILYEHRSHQQVVMDPTNAFLLTNILEGVMVSPGTGSKASFGRPSAGKTGTTNDDTNAWFVGYTPDLVAAVWMGYDDQNISMKNVYGGNYPGAIWKTIMSKAHAGLPVRSFPIPAGVTNVSVCKASGKLPNGFCPADQQISEIFVENKAPTEICDLHVQAEICAESGKLATPYCYTRITGVYIKRGTGLEAPPGDPQPQDLPWESCTLHGPGAFSIDSINHQWNNGNNGNHKNDGNDITPDPPVLSLD